MVTTVTSYGRSGLSDWLVQRVSAVILAVYSIFMVLLPFVKPTNRFCAVERFI